MTGDPIFLKNAVKFGKVVLKKIWGIRDKAREVETDTHTSSKIKYLQIDTFGYSMMDSQ